LSTKTDRTLFFDFLPLDLGKIRGMRTKLQLYTVPGQVYYNSTRQLVLKGADGIVFVADSQDFALDANLESLQNLEDNLKLQGVRIREIPLVMQYNKRDLPNALPVAEMQAEINELGVPHFESVATTGIAVEETLKGITQLVLAHLIRKYGLEGSEPIDRDIQILNAQVAREQTPAESLWDEEENAGVVVDDAGEAADAPMVAASLTLPPAPPPPAAGPFTEITDYFGNAPAAVPEFETEIPHEVPMASIEIPLPEGILNSLPELGSASSSTVAAPPVPGRRVTDGLVKEVTVPLNLTLDELRQHRRLRLKITLDVNLLG